MLFYVLIIILSVNDDGNKNYDDYGILIMVDLSKAAKKRFKKIIKLTFFQSNFIVWINQKSVMCHNNM